MVQLHEYEPYKSVLAMLVASQDVTPVLEVLMQPNNTPSAPHVKICSKCGESKPATTEYFARDNRSPKGLQPKCKVCNRAYREANKEHRSEYIRAYSRTHKRPYSEKRAEYNRQYLRAYFADPVNKEKKAEYDRVYREVNKEKINERIAKWHANNPHKVKEYRVRSIPNRDGRRAIKYRYLARKRNAEGSHTTGDIKRQYEAQKGRCYYCQTKVGDDYHVDHVIPLSRGGSNGPENIVIACVSCNTSKRDKLPHEWVQGGRLL